MGNYDELKQAVSDVIKTNGNQEITGQVLQNTLVSIINTVGANATFAGIATPETNPGTPDQNIFYIASEDGVYVNFNSIKLENEVSILENKNGNWVKTISELATMAKLMEVEYKAGTLIDTIISNNGSKNVEIKNPIHVKRGSFLYINVLNNNYESDVSFFFKDTLGKYYQLDNNGEKYFYVYNDIDIDMFGFNCLSSEDKLISAHYKIQYVRGRINNIVNSELGINLFEYNYLQRGYITTNGDISSDYNGAITPIVNVKMGDTYIYTGGFSVNDDLSMVWGYSEDGSVKKMLLQSKQEIYYNTEIQIPDGIDYIIAWSDDNSIIPQLTKKKSALQNMMIKEAIGNNLYNYRNSIADRYVDYSSGKEMDAVGFYASEFIKIKSNTEYFIKYGQQQFAFFDNNKNYISGQANAISQYFITPSNASFIRITVDEEYNKNQILSEAKNFCNEEYNIGFKELSILDTKIVTNGRTRIVATRNEQNFNSIRELIESLPADSNHPYEIFVPKGRWHECDLRGKKYVYIIGEDMYETIIYNDGLSNNITPNNYPFGLGGKPLNEIPKDFKHIIYAQNDLNISNVRLETNDCKYCVHLDNLYYNNIVINNCIIATKENVNFPIGIGIYGGQNINIMSSIIIAYDKKEGIFCHNWNNQRFPSSIIIKDTLFDGCDFLMVDELGSEQNDLWQLINCKSTKPKGGNVSFMVDYNNENKTYWINNNGENESDPQKVPYSIKLNTLGSNVNAFIPINFFPTGVVARPNMEKYIISDNFLKEDIENQNIGDVLISFNGEYNDIELKILGVIQNIIDGKMYISLTGKGVCIKKNIITDDVSDNQKLYVNSQKKITTSKTERFLGVSQLLDDKIIINI